MSDTSSNKASLVKLVAFLAFFLAIAIQIQTSILADGNYKGIRINVADIALPFAGIGILSSLLLKRSHWPQWSVPFCYGFLAALTGMITFALINGYLNNGEWTTWALVNKYTGWFILLAYFALGGWMTRNYGKETLPVIIKSFVYFALIVTLVFTLKDYATHFITEDGRALYKAKTDGFSGNRNAYVFTFFAVLTLASLIKTKGQFLMKPPVTMSLWAITPLFLLYNGSRAGFVIIFLLLLFLTITNFRFYISRIIPAVLLCGLIIATTIGADVNDYVLKQHVKRGSDFIEISQADFSAPQNLDEEFNNRKSEYIRVRVFHDAIDLWKTAPLTGAGLGTFLHSQYEKYDPETTIIEIIDTTPLWLLTETGIIGLLCFLTFYAMALYSLWQYRRENPDTLHGQFAGAVIIIMIGFGLMSLLHELLYTRFLWLFMGLALGLPAQKASSRIKAEIADTSPISDT